MRFQGRITEWNDERGFGFITPDGGGQHVFFHIKSLPRSSHRPVREDRVEYAVETDEHGRIRAAKVALVDRARVPMPMRGTRPAILAVAAIFVLLMATLISRGNLPLLVGLTYAIASVITYCSYASDKAAAKAGQWRTPESTLHMLGLIGGWPGGLVAQQLLRHKSKKASFIFVFWLSVAVNILGLIWLMSATGQEFVQTLLRGDG